MANEFIVETSARHVHVTQETLEKLFGEGYQLTPKKELSQPGQYASNERVTVVGPKKELANVSILGPCRKLNQVELSATDARSIGIAAPIRESGDVAGSGACKLVGPAGEVELSEGVIVAKRHIHMTEKDAADFGVTNGELVNVLIENENGRKTIYGDTVVRVSNSYALAMHVDTDESNAAACAKVQMGKIVR
ncbi:MAG: phosphate propanoyltransferase [Candidatus Ornithospirochaeta sp.]|nr:phosphate propanoyltransferase [Candidatus Ornithospirochaeta sp.]